MDVCYQSCSDSWLAGRPSAHLAWQKNFDVEHYTQAFSTGDFGSAMFIGTINLYHFIPHSVFLTLAEGHKVYGKQNLFISFSYPFLI